jgi:hypothetical protein
VTAPLVLLGRLVTFDPAQPEIDQGALYIGGDELIAAVQKAADPPLMGSERLGGYPRVARSTRG